MNSTILQVDYNDYKYDDIGVLDPSSQQLLYHLARTPGSDRPTVTNSEGRIVGSVGTVMKSSRIDIETINTAGITSKFELQTPKVIGKSNTFSSPAFGGQEMVWKSKPMSTKIVYDLQDDKGIELAHFESVGMSSNKIGSLKISDAVIQQDIMDEIMVTLLSLILHKMRTIEQANSITVGMSMKSR